MKGWLKESKMFLNTDIGSLARKDNGSLARK